MQVAFFLIPKSQVAWLPIEGTLGEATELFDQSGFTAVPLLRANGGYAGTITEGDLLRALLRSPRRQPSDASALPLTEGPLRTTVRPVGIDAEMEELWSRAVAQNFVPVTDSRGVFVGIVRRREILAYCARVVHGAR
jgi:CBS-domain-containing membrane protein